MPHIEADILRHLNSVVRVQLSAVKQHFIHVLILKAWGDAETAEGIMAIDEVDLPNAMRIADFIVSNGAVPELCANHSALAENMPAPGSSHEEILAAEHRLESKLVQVLMSAKASLTSKGADQCAHLIVDPLAPRERYAQWLQEQVKTGPRSNGMPRRLSESATLGLNALFAHLMVVIEQGLVHSFVHWHSGRKELADAAWSMSGAAMMQATEITNHLALRYSAPSPASVAARHLVRLPRVGHSSEEALNLDRAMAERCRDVAGQASEDLAGTEFETLCGDSAAYFQALASWQPDLDHPEVPNPCRDFERVLRKYVWKRDGTNLVSA